MVKALQCASCYSCYLEVLGRLGIRSAEITVIYFGSVRVVDSSVRRQTITLSLTGKIHFTDSRYCHRSRLQLLPYVTLSEHLNVRARDKSAGGNSKQVHNDCLFQ